MIITQTEYEKIFTGFYINDVAVRNTGYIYITAREKVDIDPVMQEHLAKKKFISFLFDEPLGKQWGASGYEGMDKILSVSATVPYSQYIGVTMENEVFAVGSGFVGLEAPIPMNLQLGMFEILVAVFMLWVARVASYAGLTEISGRC